VVLSLPALAAMHQGVLMTPAKLDQLEAWVQQHYRDRLALADLADPSLRTESRQALDELTALLDLGCCYSFQQ